MKDFRGMNVRVIMKYSLVVEEMYEDEFITDAEFSRINGRISDALSELATENPVVNSAGDQVEMALNIKRSLSQREKKIKGVVNGIGTSLDLNIKIREAEFIRAVKELTAIQIKGRSVGQPSLKIEPKVQEDFIVYWTQRGKNDLLMKFEREDIFDLSKRLRTFQQRSNKDAYERRVKGGAL